MKDVLVGVRLFGGRDFGHILAKFQEMHEVCIKPYADTIVVGDNGDFAWSLDALYSPAETSSTYAEDMLAIADERSRVRAIEGGYSKVLWQDVDCLYDTSADFERLISHDVAGVGALTSARGNPHAAIARRFVGEDGEQEDIPDEELLRAIEGKAEPHSEIGVVPDDPHVIAAGFPGAGALCLRVDDIRDLSWDDPDLGAVKWYDRVAQGRPNICLQEQFCLWMIERGRAVYLDTQVRVWHCAEDDTAGRYPGENTSIESLVWL